MEWSAEPVVIGGYVIEVNMLEDSHTFHFEVGQEILISQKNRIKDRSKS